MIEMIQELLKRITLEKHTVDIQLNKTFALVNTWQIYKAQQSFQVNIKARKRITIENYNRSQCTLCHVRLSR